MILINFDTIIIYKKKFQLKNELKPLPKTSFLHIMQFYDLTFLVNFHYTDTLTQTGKDIILPPHVNTKL